MKITVIGLGYVGAVTSACLARDGHEVLGIDLDPVKIELLRNGQSPVFESEIPEITEIAVNSGRLRVAANIDSDALKSDVIFVCVGTPSAANGSQDLSAVSRVCEQIGAALSDTETSTAVVIRSTVPAGTTDTVVREALERSSGKQAGVDFGLGFQPEFLREGSSVHDFYHPPMTIVGGDAIAANRLQEIFRDFEGDFIATDVKSAELLKVACNSFHALKINFANEIGRIAQALGMDARNVMELLCEDKQLNISPAYLRPGFAFGGSCLPKDLRALLHVAKSNDVDVPMLQGILPSNDAQIELVARMIMNQPTRRVGLIGLSFKQGTDDLRESPLVRLAETLIGKGYELTIYDPAVKSALLLGSNKKFIESTIPHFAGLLCDELSQAVQPGQTTVIAHLHDKLESVLSTLDGETLVVDLVGIEPVGRAMFKGVAW